MDSETSIKNGIFWDAVRLGDVATFKQQLVELPDLVNAVHPEEKLSAFEIALASGFVALAETLLEYAEFNLNHAQHNPLRLAVELGFVELAERLLHMGALPNYRPRGMSSALLLCLEKEYYDLAELMIAKGAEVNIRNDKGWTPLIWA